MLPGALAGDGGEVDVRAWNQVLVGLCEHVRVCMCVCVCVYVCTCQCTGCVCMCVYVPNVCKEGVKDGNALSGP